MERFIILFSPEVLDQKLPGWEEFAAYPEETCWCLYETDGKKPVRLVGTDGGEPEDQKLVRDWRWVPEELNHLFSHFNDLAASLVELAEENAHLRRRLKNLIEGE